MTERLPRLVVAVKDQTGWPVTAWSAASDGPGSFAGRLRLEAAAAAADDDASTVRITPQFSVQAGDADELAALAAIVYAGGVEADDESTCAWYKILRCSDSTVHALFEAAAMADNEEEEGDKHVPSAE